MTNVELHLPDFLRAAIARHVASGRVDSEACFLQAAVRHYLAELDAADELADVIRASLASIQRGDYLCVATRAQPEPLPGG